MVAMLSELRTLGLSVQHSAGPNATACLVDPLLPDFHLLADASDCKGSHCDVDLDHKS